MSIAYLIDLAHYGIFDNNSGQHSSTLLAREIFHEEKVRIIPLYLDTWADSGKLAYVSMILYVLAISSVSFDRLPEQLLIFLSFNRLSIIASFYPVAKASHGVSFYSFKKSYRLEYFVYLAGSVISFYCFASCLVGVLFMVRPRYMILMY
jgi:hypothetical protein